MKSTKRTFRYLELPFIEKCEEKPLIGDTWSYVIKNAKLPYASYIIYADDNVLYFPECANEQISGGSVTITLGIQGGAVDFLRNPITIALLLVGGPLAWSKFGKKALMDALGSVGLSMLVGVGVGALRAAFEPDPPEVDSRAGRNRYSLVGGQNQSQMNNPFPAVLGKALIVPPFVAQYYIAMDDKTSGRGEQYLYALLNLGYGPLSVGNIRIGETLVAENSGDVRNGNITTNNTLRGVNRMEVRI